MGETEKLTQLEKRVRRIDFRIELLKKKRKDLTLDMMSEIIKEENVKISHCVPGVQCAVEDCYYCPNIPARKIEVVTRKRRPKNG